MGMKLSSSSIRCSKCGRLTTVKRLMSNVFGYRGPNGERWNATLCYNCEAKLQLIFNLQGEISSIVNRLKAQWRWNQKKRTGTIEEVMIK